MQFGGTLFSLTTPTSVAFVSARQRHCKWVIRVRWISPASVSGVLARGRDRRVRGALLTRALVFSGSELMMDYSTSAAGSVQVELQDAQGLTLPGFALADSEVMYGDSLEQPICSDAGFPI